MSPGGRLPCVAALLALIIAVQAAAAPEDEARLLLSLKASIDQAAAGSWDAALGDPACQAPAGAAWEGAAPCGSGASPQPWRGVSCSAQGAVTSLNLSSCSLKGSLPGGLAQLQQLSLLDLSHNALTGSIPPAWTAAGAFPALETLQLAHNDLTGALSDFNMAAGGFIASRGFNVSTNAFSQGDIPTGWYSPTLLLMDVSYNDVSGPLPLEWGQPVAGQQSAFPSLVLLAIQGNNLSGPSDPWPRGYAIFGPNFVCIGEPGNELLEMAPAPTAGGDDAGSLLTLKAAVSNWDTALSSTGCLAPAGSDWVQGSQPCTASGAPMWRGVICDAQGAVTGLKMTGCGLKGSLPSELAQLQQLTLLDLSRNGFTGSIPPAWTAIGAFPALETLQLAHNSLSGGLDAFNTPTGFISRRSFNVSANGFNQSALPAGWYSSTLLLMDVSYNGVSGPLPIEWGLPKAGHEDVFPSAFPRLERLALEGNNLSGPADPWPRGSANTFGPNFYCTSEPGNPYLVMPESPGSPSGSSSDSSSGGGLSAGAIAGIAVGAVAALALAAALAAFVVRRRRAANGSRGLVTKHSGGSAYSGDLEKGGKPGKGGGSSNGSDGAGGLASGSAFDGGVQGLVSLPPSVVSTAIASNLSAEPLLAHGSAIERSSVRSWDSGRTFGSALVDTDAKRLPAEWNMVLFSELEMEASIGAGSFGTVYRAKYCSTAVAVKLLGTEKAPGTSDSTYDRKITRQLEKEAGIMSKLRHTNICLYMGACLEPPCLLMEYCARRSVDALLAQGLKDMKAAKQLSWPRLLSMAGDAARGMVYLHTRHPPVYHRDLKSANLLVTSQWQVKVADFNLSRALEPADFMSSLCIQNPRWLAPEVLAGEEGGLPADVWAFGTVLWELMTWRAPFESANPYQIINIVQGARRGSGLTIPSPDELPAGPLGEYPGYVDLVQSCWERDPSARPTFEEVASRLRTILQAEMRRTTDVASVQSSAQVVSPSTSPQPTAVETPTSSAQPTALASPGNLQAAIASNAGSHTSFEAATQATSRAFQEALRDSFSSQASTSQFGSQQSSGFVPQLPPVPADSAWGGQQQPSGLAPKVHPVPPTNTARPN